MTRDGTLAGGVLTVSWPGPGAAAVTITGHPAGSISVGGVTATFPRTLSADTIFDFAQDSVVTVSVTYLGVEILNQSVTLNNSSETTLAPGDLKYGAAAIAALDSKLGADAVNSGSGLGAALRNTFALKPRNGATPWGRGEIDVDPRDYGATLDGVADDTAGVQAAIATGGRCIIPPGKVARIATGVTVGLRQHLHISAGAKLQRLVSDTDTSPVVWVNRNHGKVTGEGSIEALNACPNGILHFERTGGTCEWALAKDLHLLGPGKTVSRSAGLVLIGATTFQNKVAALTISDVETGVYFGVGANANTVRDIQMFNIALYAYDLDGAIENRVEGGTVLSSPGVTVINLRDAAQGNTVAVTAEPGGSSTGYSISADSSDNLLTGTYLNTTSRGTDSGIRTTIIGRRHVKVADEFYIAGVRFDATTVGRRLATVAALLADTSASIGVGSTWLAGQYVYQEAAAGASDQHVTTAGGVKLYVLPQGDRVFLAAWGVTSSTASVTSQLTQAAAVARNVVLPSTTLNITTKPTLGANLIGSLNSWINVNILSGEGLEFAAGYGFDGVNFTSPYTGPSSVADATDSAHGGAYDYGSRSIRLNDFGFARNFEMKYAAAGILVNGAYTTVENFNIHDIHHYRGWGTAIHRWNANALYGIVRNGKVTDCDRGCETETGASYNLTEDVTFTRVGPFGYTGQGAAPTYEVYTFVLDAHSHDTEAPCVGNVYRRCKVIDSMGAITAVRSSGTSDANMPRDNVYEDIEISGYAGTAGYEAVYLQGHNNRARVRFTAGSGVTSKMMVLISNGTGNAVEVDRAEQYALPLVKVGVDNSTTDSRVIVHDVNVAPSTGTGPLVDVYGPRTDLDLDLQSVTGTGGYLTLEGTATASRTRRFAYTVATGETFAQVVSHAGPADVALDGISGVNNETAVPDIVTSGGVLRGRASGVISRSAAAVSVNLGGASSLFDNSKLDTTLGTITDAGTNSRIARHGVSSFVSTIQDPAFAAFIDNQSTTTPILWPTANLGIGTRVRVGRRSSLTRFRFKVVTQSGNYYAAITNSAGVVLWKTATTLPAVGPQSITLASPASVEVQPGEELVIFLALSSATAAVAGLSITAADQNLLATVKGTPHAVQVANLYTSNTAVGSTITLGSTLPGFQPLVTLIET